MANVIKPCGGCSSDPCGAPSLPCSIQCISATSGNDCPELSDAPPNGSGTSCEAINRYYPPCEEDGPDRTIVQTAQVRLALSGLTVGHFYKAWVDIYQAGVGLIGSLEWWFEATSTSETTSYQDVPNPSFGDGNIGPDIICNACETASAESGSPCL